MNGDGGECDGQNSDGGDGDDGLNKNSSNGHDKNGPIVHLNVGVPTGTCAARS